MVGRDRRGGQALASQIGQALDARAVARDQGLILPRAAADIDRLHVDAPAGRGGEGARAHLADLGIAGDDGREDLGAGVEALELHLPARDLLDLARGDGKGPGREARLIGDGDGLVGGLGRGCRGGETEGGKQGQASARDGLG